MDFDLKINKKLKDKRSHHEPACLFQTTLVNDTITLGYQTQIVVFRQKYCFKKKSKSNKKENDYAMEQILESFQ